VSWDVWECVRWKIGRPCCRHVTLSLQQAVNEVDQSWPAQDARRLLTGADHMTRLAGDLSNHALIVERLNKPCHASACVRTMTDLPSVSCTLQCRPLIIVSCTLSSCHCQEWFCSYSAIEALMLVDTKDFRLLVKNLLHWFSWVQFWGHGLAFVDTGNVGNPHQYWQCWWWY